MATAAATGPPTLSWIGWIRLANRNSIPCEWRSSDSARPRSRAAAARYAPYENSEQVLIAPMIACPTTGGDSDGDDCGGAFFGARLASPRRVSASPIALRLFW